jgi:hypothetical protein
MEGLARLVSDSLARHGFTPTANNARLQWSRWFRCESSFSFMLLPSEPGLFALAEEILAPGEVAATGGKRMLAVFQVCEADDLGLAMGGLFSPSNPLRSRVSAGRCFARYVIISDDKQRHAAAASLHKWISDSAESASGIAGDFTASFNPGQEPERSFVASAMSTVTPGTDAGVVESCTIQPPALPSGF